MKTSQKKDALSLAQKITIHGAVALAIVVGVNAVACAQKKPETPSVSATKKDAAAPEAQRTPTPLDASSAREQWLDAIDLGAPLPEAARAAMREQRWGDAIVAIDAVEGELAARPYHALALGYALKQAGEHERCNKTLAVALEQGTLLDGYAQLWNAECALAREDWDAATLSAAQVPAQSLAHRRGLFLLGEALQSAGESSDVKRAVRVFESYLREYPRGEHALDARLRLATHYEEVGKPDAAARHYNDIITYHPLADEVSAAIAQLGVLKPKINAATRRAISATSDEQRIRKLRALFGLHRSEDAIQNGERYARIFEQGSKLHCETLYLIGKSHTKLRQHSDSLAWYERVQRHCPSGELVMKSFYLAGKGAWNSGDRAAAKEAFERVWSDYPSHSYADDAMLYVARILREEGKLGAMRKQLRRQVKVYPKGDMAKDAHWLLVRDMLARKKYAEVVEYVSGLDDTGENDLYSMGRLRYFAGRAQEALKKKEAAADLYEQVAREHPLGYYAFLSLNRLAALQGADTAQTDDVCALARGSLCEPLTASASADVVPAIELDEALREDANFKRGAALLELGIDELAGGEFRALYGRYAKEPRTLWALAMLLDAAGAHPLSHNIPRRKIEGWQQSYPHEATLQHWQIAYPRPFQELVTEWADKRGVPPQIVWAIMREESGFEPSIESWANARGLLQLMSGTAKAVASRDGLEGFGDEDLFDAGTNVRLGTAYMKELGAEFDSHPALIIAGYNAGAANVRRWLDERGDLALDLWVEDIPYGQTRHYTKRVLTSFWTYNWLYEDRRTPGVAFDLNG